MKKKLPSVYANKIEKTFHNNKKVFYGTGEEEKRQEPIKKDSRTPELTVSQKINRLFASTTYIYKADVKITLQNQTIEKRIIGRNRRNLITMDNELIPIDEIQDIESIKK